MLRTTLGVLIAGVVLGVLFGIVLAGAGVDFPAGTWLLAFVAAPLCLVLAVAGAGRVLLACRSDDQHHFPKADVKGH